MRLLRTILTTLAVSTAIAAYSLPENHFAKKSVLADGKWVRVAVDATGMYQISDSELRAMGFANPQKVRVYGKGGRALPEGLHVLMPDDLPQLPSVRTAKGIVFYATDCNTWAAARSGNAPYTHAINPYFSDASYYFLSDSDAPEVTLPQMKAADGVEDVITTFYAHLVHEQEMQAAGESGRTLLGEDFRSQKSRQFDFDLVDNAGGWAGIKVSFAAYSSGNSSIIISANGTRLPSTASDKMGVPGGDVPYCGFMNTYKEFDNPGDKLRVGIQYDYSGALFMSRLDYIEAFYERALRLRNGQLHFYHDFTVGTTVNVAGCSADTRIWDVTDPWAPEEVKFTLSGDKATFDVPSLGYREFVAFNPAQVAPAVKQATAVANQNLHALPVPDMLIISPAQYTQAARRIAAVHEKADSMRVQILTPEEIYNEFSGGMPDVTAFRLLLKMWHDRQEARTIRYCLIMGKPTYDPKRKSEEWRNLDYATVPIWESLPASNHNEVNSYCSDDYIGMLDDVAPSAMSLSTAKLHVAVGRIPCKSASEADAVAAKIEKYALSPDLGEWRNKVMLIADDEDAGVHFAQAQRVYDAWNANEFGSRTLVDRLYIDQYDRVYTSVGASYPQATKRMLQNYNDGVAYTNYIGHGGPTGWGHEHLWEWKDIESMANRRLPFMYTATCRFTPFDAPAVSAGEHLVLNPDGGAIAMITTTRTVYISQNGNLNEQMARSTFVRDEKGLPPRFGDIYLRGRNNYLRTDGNSLRYTILGDPALRLPSPTPEVRVREINGVDVTDIANPLPEVEALGLLSVKGDVVDADGVVMKDFNGTVNMLLMDAERPVALKGNGTGSGSYTAYNDRKTRLASVNVRVKNGLFETSLRIPAEIENNYSPARLTLYAWDDKGREAAGDCDRFYVYGFDDSQVSDTIGPKIEQFYLNTPSFANGGVVNSSPILFARVSDDSGINLSDAGVGHRMSAIIDGNLIFDDVNAYFTSDPDAEGAGTVQYPLKDIAAGKHQLLFTVWDNANNVSKQTIDFNVGAATEPAIISLTASANPAVTDVTFRLVTDRPNSKLSCTIGVYDLNGRCVWSNTTASTTDFESNISARWDLRDSSGNRVPRGIYLYRATVETPEGSYTSKTMKLAVAAE